MATGLASLHWFLSFSSMTLNSAPWARMKLHRREFGLLLSYLGAILLLWDPSISLWPKPICTLTPVSLPFLLHYTEAMKAFFAIWLEHLLRSLLPFPLRSQLSPGTIPTAGVWDCSLDMDLGNWPCLSSGLGLDDLQSSLPTTTILRYCGMYVPHASTSAPPRILK